MSTNQQSDKIDFILFLNSRKQIAIYVPSYVNLFTNNIYFNKIKNSQVRVVLDVAFRTQWRSGNVQVRKVPVSIFGLVLRKQTFF